MLYPLLFAVLFGPAFGIGQNLSTGFLSIPVTAVIEFLRTSAVIVMLLVFNCALLVFCVICRTRR